MESHNNFTKYEDVNKEIQSMLALKEEGPQRQTMARCDSTLDILTLLESLNRTYSEINAALKTENSQALKDVILKSDIKMSMVCETLLETLKKTTEDKNNLLRENQEIDRFKRELENKEAASRIQIGRLNSDLEFKKRNIEELNRIIKDQKDRMGEFRDELQKARSEVLFFKAKIDEIENLRSRGNEKLMIYEREMEALSQLIREKDECFSALMKEKKEEESKNSTIKTRVVELESLLDVLSKKIETKDKNLSLCNSELSKVLCENKKLKVEYEKHKESSTYYESLYNSLNAQNSYLNEQLNRMLKNSEYSKDIDGFIAKFKEKIKRNKRKIRKLEKENKKLRMELEKNKNVQDSMSPNDTSDSLMKKIDDLTSKNKEYERQLDRLEDEKKSIERRAKSLGIKDMDIKHTDSRQDALKGNLSSKNAPELSFRQPHIRTSYHPLEPHMHPLGRRLDDYGTEKTLWKSRYLPESDREIGIYKGADDGNHLETRSYLESLKPKIDGFSHNKYHSYGTPHERGISRDLGSFNVSQHVPKPSYAEAKTFNEYLKTDEKNSNAYLRLFNLENNYEERGKDDFVGGFPNDSSIPKSKLELEYDTKNDEEGKLFEAGTAFDQNKYPITQPVGTADPVRDNPAIENPSLDESVDSIKTYRTTSTLKEMMTRTNNLQKKFEDLENQLANINEGESVDKLTDKIRTYNSYYSDWNPESNDSDHI